MIRRLTAAIAGLAAVATVACTAALLTQRPAHAAAAAAQADSKPLKALLVIGGCCHDYKAQQTILKEGIEARANVEVTIAYDPDTGTKHLNPVYKDPEWSKNFDVVIHDECSADVTDLEMVDRILKPHRDGLPAIVLHCGMHSYRTEGYPDKDTPWFEFTGVATTAHGPHEPLTIAFTDEDHPITRGMKGWTTGNEELYNNVRPLMKTTHPLARGKQGNAESVVAWTQAYGDKKTRVFATTLGHANELVGDARYLDLVTRGLLWSADKLDDKHLKPARNEPKAEAQPANATLVATAQAQAAGCECEDDAQ
jgi:type 1 glutamine amidotransferase